MNTHTAPDPGINPIHAEILVRACAGRHPTTARQIRRDVIRFVLWSKAAEVDPIRPSRAELDRYRDSLDPTPVGQGRWKIDYALRAFATAGGALADEHGLGTGNSSKTSGTLDDPGLAYVVSTFIAARESARDRSVYRSGVNKLVAGLRSSTSTSWRSTSPTSRIFAPGSTWSADRRPRSW